jgi:serine/threonine protein phosphatase PrpC
VGDSRAYLLRDGALRQITTDHSVVAELIAAGQLTEAEAEIDPRRAMITRALGLDVDVEVDVIPVAVAAGDRLLLCSDGLTTMLRDDAIAGVLRSEADRGRAARELVEAANDAGGTDNITVLLIDVVDDDAASNPEPPPEPEAPPVASDPDADTLDLGESPPVDPLSDLDIDLDEPLPQPESVPKRHWWQRRDRS